MEGHGSGFNRAGYLGKSMGWGGGGMQTRVFHKSGHNLEGRCKACGKWLYWLGQREYRRIVQGALWEI